MPPLERGHRREAEPYRPVAAAAHMRPHHQHHALPHASPLSAPRPAYTPGLGISPCGRQLVHILEHPRARTHRNARMRVCTHTPLRCTPGRRPAAPLTAGACSRLLLHHPLSREGAGQHAPHPPHLRSSGAIFDGRSTPSDAATPRTCSCASLILSLSLSLSLSFSLSLSLSLVSRPSLLPSSFLSPFLPATLSLTHSLTLSLSLSHAPNSHPLK